MPKVKKVPLRMCIGCQEMKPKRELTRVVRTPQNTVEIDATGKKSGRGAYLCSNIECLQRAIKGKRLERSLECFISPEIIETLKQGMVK
ncbi:RNase P modulator RnpM [Desulfotomaculum sp. 1211_IL3151]|uniref:RNase P modulator RnpM n=1 Tax=Desulfotomaculum sp. 1211_IL3151 TaxID=3084055 RepID=UPI002FD88472